VNVRVRLIAVVLGGLVLPSAARAQSERLAGRLDERTRAAVVAIVDSERSAGVPADPLINKALEGASKGADGARIVAAVRALAGDLARARAALGQAVTEPELVAGAAALRAGAAPVFLERLHGNYPRESLVVPLAVMADLVARGVPADTAAQSVLALMREGVREAELVAFRQSVERDIALGAPAGAAAAVRVSDAATTLAPGGQPASPPPRPRKP
jgi:hypothetical protein